MPIASYSVLKGTPVSGALSTDARPHYLIEVNANSVSWQVAVNVESDTGAGTNAQVLYAIDENWTPPDPAALTALAAGATSLAGLDAAPAIDYLRSTVNGQPLITRAQMQLLPLPGDDAAENLKNAVIQYLNQAIADPQGTVYAFGSLYTSGNGIHDIHMNQGNPPSDHGADNGIWQDGLLVFSMPASTQWVAIFLAFQDESWTTDENGNPLTAG